MAKLRMAHASTHGARKPPGPKLTCKELIYLANIIEHKLTKLDLSLTQLSPSLFSFFLFSPSLAFDPLRGNSSVGKFVSPNILADKLDYRSSLLDHPSIKP